MELLPRHAICHELRSEVFEQFRIGRPFARHSEIIGRIRDAPAHVPSPDAIGDHTRGNGLGRDHPREFQPAAALVETLRHALCEDRGEGARSILGE